MAFFPTPHAHNNNNNNNKDGNGNSQNADSDYDDSDDDNHSDGGDGKGDAGGAWIGLDWGTTNSAVAVYCRNRGRCKWLRLPGGGMAIHNDGDSLHKVGRLVPSVAVVATHDYVQQQQLRQQQSSTKNKNDDTWMDVSEIFAHQAPQQQHHQYSNHNHNPPEENQRPGDKKTRYHHHHRLYVSIGASAVAQVASCWDNITTTTAAAAALNDKNNINAQQQAQQHPLAQEKEDPAVWEAAQIVHLKRQLLQWTTTTSSSSSSSSSPQQQQEQRFITVTPLGMSESLRLDGVAVVACFLQALRRSADQYLAQAIPQKGLQIPGGQQQHLHVPIIQHVCLGVPAQASVVYRQWMRQAARWAGFQKVITVTESTAAAMAYGLFVGRSPAPPPPPPTLQQLDKEETNHSFILVFDMGGGTTDVTIAEQVNQQRRRRQGDDDNHDNNSNIKKDDQGFRVVLTTGNNQLGGNDMDQALLELVLEKLTVNSSTKQQEQEQPYTLNNRMPRHQTAHLLRQCRMAKERLCGAGGEAAAASAVVVVQGMRVTIHQDELVRALEPVLLQTRQVVQSALEQFQTMMQQQQQQQKQKQQPSDSSMVASTAEIREVILIGGASAVPAVRQLLASLFPKVPELCVSVNAHSAVAQGCAIAAALASHHVPRHELESALMLDTSPHPIGVLTATNHFVEILPAQATLPAKGFATFTLADPCQRGVTVRAVERVWLDERYNDSKNKQKPRQKQQREQFVPLGEFTFLLHRLPNHDPRTTSSRSVDIGMVLRINGEFVVSIFDPNDPEHVRRKERARNQQSAGSDDILAFRDMVVAEEALSWEQILLMVACIVVFMLYVAAKVVFADENKILLNEGRS